MEEKFMKEALKEAKKAYEKEEVPVGAVIVKDGKIIARAHNLKETKKDTTRHAEIIAIQKASKKLNAWRLEDCEMYVTLEPCSMCKEIIKKSRIKNIYYYAIQNNSSYEKEPNYIHINNNYFPTILTNFFKNVRKK